MPLAEEEVGREMWAIEVPNIAFDHPYVYSAVLAVAALHLLTDNPNDVLLQTATYQYIDESLSGYRNELSNINSDNALAVFTASILLGLNARLRYRCLGNNPPPYSLPLEFLHLQRGTKEIFYRTNQVIAGSGAKKWVDIRTDLRGEPIPRPIETSAPYVNSHGFEFPSDRFLFCWDSSISLSIPSERKAVYDAALKYLAGLKDGMGYHDELRWIQRRLTWLIHGISREFVAYLEEGDPLAIVILSRFFALLKYVDESWWIAGSAEFEVLGMASLVGDEWKWAMEWPLEVLKVAVRVGAENMAL